MNGDLCRTSYKELGPAGEWREVAASERPPGEWGGREALERTSIKRMYLLDKWGWREALNRTSFKGLSLPGECGRQQI